MEILGSIFKLLAGVGMFLFAMYLLEESLRNLSGRNFKLFLQRITKNRVGAVTGGAIVTAVLQSSSMVSLIVLAFLGAGVFTMKDSMAIILGANLGTTIDSWLVATLGFKVQIEMVAYPAILIGGLLLILFSKRNTIKYISYFLLGFALLFIGLSFMKTAMETQVKETDISKYAEMSHFVFLGIGFVVTLLVQSSSVTMALTLSALNAGAISFPQAAVIVIGSETGTTIKILLGAIGGTASKKRVALGNFIFNIFLTVFAFSLLKLILRLITDVFNIHDPLIGLVTFSSLVNLISIIIFLPFLDQFAIFLERFFKNTDASVTAFIGNTTVDEPEKALGLFRQETEYFIYNAMLFNLSLFDLHIVTLNKQSEFKHINEKRKFLSKTSEEKYEQLKQLQGELQAFYLKWRSKLKDKDQDEINRLISSVRSSMYSAKGVKDIGRNITNLSHSSKNVKFNFFMQHKKETKELYKQFISCMWEEKSINTKKLKGILKEVHQNYSSGLDEFYLKAEKNPIEGLDITTVINFNRELLSSNKAMMKAITDFLLQESEAADLSEMSTYLT